MSLLIKGSAANPQILLGALSFDATPCAPLAGTVDDFDPPNRAGSSGIALSASAAFTINGIAGGTPNQLLLLINQSAFAGTIAANAGSSAPANQFASAATVAAGTSLLLVYSGSLSQWCPVGAGSGGAVPTGANPSALVGLVPVNGVATTFTRSDGAPALSQSIIPTWTGIHTWSLAEPRLKFNETDVGADLKLWDVDINAGVFTRRTRTDADGAGQTFETITRGATTNVTSLQWNTTGGFAPTQLKLDSQASLFLETTYATGDLSFDVKNNSNAALATASIDLFAGTGANTVNAIYTSFNAAASMLSQFGAPAPATGGVAFFTSTSAAALNATIMLAPNTVPGLIMLGDNSLSTFYMPLTSTGAVTGASFRPSAAAVPPNGLYLPAANTVGFATNTTNRLNIDSAGTWLLAGAAGTAGNVLTSAGPGAPPTWAAGGGAVGANPTGLIGLAAVNGVATTFTRSDSTHALDQSIAPTWTAAHIFTAAGNPGGIQLIATASPTFYMKNSGAAADLGGWRVGVGAGSLSFLGVDDALAVTRSALSFARGAGVAIAGVTFGNATDNTTYTFTGTSSPKHGSAAFLLQTSVALNNGAAAGAGTLTNAPVSGNPTKWIPINDNGTTRYVPSW